MTKQNPKWLPAAIHLAQTNNKAETARKVGVSPQTIHNWLKNPEFQGLLEKERQAYSNRIRDQYIVLRERAQKKILEVMDSKKSPPSIQLRAAIELEKVGGRSAVERDIIRELKKLITQQDTEKELLEKFKLRK